MRKLCLLILLVAVPVTAEENGGTPKPAEPVPEPKPGEPTSEPVPPAEAPGDVPASTEPAPVEEPPPPVEEPKAKTGKIAGVVIDAKTGEALIEAQVTVVQTKERVLTDIDGNYEVSLPPGTYDIRVFSELRPARRISKITVEAGKTTRIDVQLGGGEEKIAVQEVVVTAKPDTATEAVQIVRRQKAAVVQDAVSAEQISRTPDSNAGEAIKRVVAATVQDNKYVVVRGLGGRYSNTLLNGVALPSPDPDNPAAPLDLFPASLLANLTVSKTFSADIPGNFAGGSLQIETREFPTRFVLKLRGSLSGDSETTLQSTPSSRGGSLDFLGVDDGTRSLPAAIPGGPVGGLPPGERNRIGKAFNNNWTIRSNQPVPNAGLAATVGDTLNFGGKRLGYLASLSYGYKWTRREAVSRTWLSEGQPREEFEVDLGQESVGLGALLNVGYALTPTQRLGLISLYTRSTDDSAQTVTGAQEQYRPRLTRRSRIRFVERSMSFTQLSGEHLLGKPTLGWQANVAVTGQDEPDMRDMAYVQGTDEVFRFISQSGSGERTFNELSDLSLGGGGDVTIPFDSFKLKAGATAQFTSRDFVGRRFRYQAINQNMDTLALPPEELFVPERVGTDLQFDEFTLVNDSYDYNRNIFAGYALADVATWDPLRIVAGVRVEAATQKLRTFSDFSTPVNVGDAESRTDVNVLPALNLVYGLSQGMNLRASYSLTLARPQIRELAPVVFFDYARNRTLSGNPDLEITQIHNADLRWEWFFGATELVAASVFYKRFINPIESTIFSGSEDITFVNALGADSVGGELELRASPGRFVNGLENMRVAANLALVFSDIRLDANDPLTANLTSKDRPLQGQSPYVANIEIGYRVPATGTDLGLLYNVFGPRISDVGAFMFPDVEEQPFHRLDFTLIQKLPDSLNLKISATNLLNQRVRFVQGGVENFGYDPGVSFVASLEWSYEPEGKDK